ncbi:serine hydrolase domain-containing protein [Methanoplanus endosymbiosus]|uniref:Beta-lactamase family protein n=1 Tax=Methanoplanus endosymbiosus TaxID=33865 RepID=A0A9E7PKW8_9EURY|nr:serine hydrolase domain-containing protein [Methanoplanus endosymbiosus]UUX91172.1 beta-lactamase family protein [Methanoplanus endosymbiosus]
MSLLSHTFHNAEWLQKSGMVAAIVLLICSLVCLPVNAAVPSVNDSSGFGLTDIEKFFDEAVPVGLAKYNIPGATVSAVQDGELVFTKGYGYSDIAGKSPVISDETLFHIGSITKLFTWTSIMQLVEDGVIDLDADVNIYLRDFSIPDTYPGEPITMRDLMTHSAGFEDSEVHMSVADADDLYSFRVYCRDNIPARVYPPGTVTSYSNYGTALAAVIIEDVTGTPYKSYVTDNILHPLGMNDTVISYPLSPEYDVLTSSGYHFEGGKNVAVPDTVFTIGPAGTISSTATDMAKFISVHMENGTWHGAEILSGDTAALMHSPAFSNDPRVSSMCLGFYETRLNGERFISHGGDTDTFHSLIAINPDKKAGFFVSYNSPGGNQARNDLMMAFADNYWLAEEGADETLSESESSLQKYAGTYQSTRHNYRTFEYYISPPDQTEVIAGDNNSIYMLRGGNPPAEYTAVAPGVFALSGGEKSFSGNLVFREDENGNVEFMCLENIPVFAFERVDWYETTPFTDWVANMGLILILTALIWPVMAECRRTYGNADGNSVMSDTDEPEKENGQKSLCDALPFYARLTAGTASILFIVFIIFIIPSVVGSGEIIISYAEGMTVPAALAAALTVSLIASLLSVIAALFIIPVWTKRWWSLWQRVHYTIVVIGLLMLVWWVNYWNLFVFRL